MIRPFFVILTTALGLSSCHYLFPENIEPTKIVLIGDSITQGRKGNPEKAQPPTYSWRYPFWQKLIDRQIKFDLVGSTQNGFEGDPDWPDYKGKSFDRDHEAHWGWDTKKIATHLPQSLNRYTPDIALVMLGTNDVKEDKNMHTKVIEEATQNMASIINALRQDNPNVIILIGEPFQEWEPFPEMVIAYQQLAQQLTTEQSQIFTVKTNTNWISPPDEDNTCTLDWVHPNLRGDKIIAQAFYQAIKPHLQIQ